MRREMKFVAALLLVCAAAAEPALAQAHGGALGPEQEFLAKRAGEYTRVIKFVGQQGAWNGTSKISVILGGRFLLEETRDTVFGRPVEGMRIYGYNNSTKEYEMITMYTMSTAITKLTGTSDDGGKSVDYAGISDEPQGKVPLRAQVRQIDDDHFVVTLSTAGPDGKSTPFQETTYTRKK
jgi:hypothetical protein